jgi:hypothetical protein
MEKRQAYLHLVNTDIAQSSAIVEKRTCQFRQPTQDGKHDVRRPSFLSAGIVVIVKGALDSTKSKTCAVARQL